MATTMEPTATERKVDVRPRPSATKSPPPKRSRRLVFSIMSIILLGMLILGSQMVVRPVACLDR